MPGFSASEPVALTTAPQYKPEVSSGILITPAVLQKFEDLALFSKDKNKLPELIKLTDDGISHVKDRHVAGNNPYWEHKSKWTINNAEWKSVTRDVFRNPDKVSYDGNRIIFEKDIGKKVGVSSNGDALTKVRVVTESDGSLVTSFPQKEFK